MLNSISKFAQIYQQSERTTTTILEATPISTFMRKCLKIQSEHLPTKELLKTTKKTSRTKLFLTLEQVQAFLVSSQQEAELNTSTLLKMLILQSLLKRLLLKMDSQIRSQSLRERWRRLYYQ